MAPNFSGFAFVGLTPHPIQPWGAQMFVIQTLYERIEPALVSKV